MWSIWNDLQVDLQLRESFVPIIVLKDDPNCQALFAPVPQLHIPAGLAPGMVQALLQAYLQQVQHQAVPPATFENNLALMESLRHASRMRVAGRIFAARQHDLTFNIRVEAEKVGWVDVALPLPAPAGAPAGDEGDAGEPQPEPQPEPPPLQGGA
jgi:hypothetical protein